MVKKNKEILWFIIFSLLSIAFHFSTNNQIELNNDWLETGLNYFNFFIHHTFKPIEVFFHEASHALMAIATGGEFYNINVSWRGAGYVSFGESTNLKMAIVAFSGYVGAAIWGYLIYSSSLHSKKYSRFLLIGFCLCFLFKAENVSTVAVLGYIVAVFLVAWLSKNVGAYLMRFIGIFIMISAVFSPTYLVNYATQGDHVLMQQYTAVPAIVWVITWVLIGFVVMWMSFKKTTSSR